MKKLLMAAIAFICMAMTGIVLTACGSDGDDDVKTYTYTILFEVQSFNYESLPEDDSWNGAEKMKAWVNSILSAYETALGVSSDTFMFTGTQTECDKKVQDACKKAEATVATFKSGTGRVTVKNQTTNKTVYNYFVQ